MASTSTSLLFHLQERKLAVMRSVWNGRREVQHRSPTTDMSLLFDILCRGGGGWSIWPPFSSPQLSLEPITRNPLKGMNSEFLSSEFSYMQICYSKQTTLSGQEVSSTLFPLKKKFFIGVCTCELYFVVWWDVWEVGRTTLRLIFRTPPPPPPPKREGMAHRCCSRCIDMPCHSERTLLLNR